MLLYAILFSLLYVVAAFGGTYLLLRRTHWAAYSLPLSLVSFHPFLILCITLFGYRPPIPLGRLHVLLPILAGICLTIAVVAWYRREIASALRETWKSSALIYGLALASLVLATPLLLSTSLAYIDWWNGELINYSYLAHGFLGLYREPSYVAYFDQNVAVRYGAELYLAALSALTQKPPLLLANVIPGLHKAVAITAFAVSCEIARKEWRLKRAAIVAADIGFAFATILSLNHVLAFLAAQTVAGSFVLLSVGLLNDGIRARRVQAFLAIHVLFVVITYAEALPFLCALAGLLFLEAIYKRRTTIAGAVVVIFGAGFLANPVLLTERLGYLYRLRMTVAGFNVLGNPHDGLVSYLAATLGFRYPYIDVPPLPDALLIVGIVLGLLAIAYGFLMTALRLRTATFLIVPILLVATHLNLGMSVQPAATSYYKSYKALAALDFYIFLAVGFLVDDLLRRRPWNPLARIPHTLLLVGAGALIVANAFFSIKAAALIRAVPSVFYEADVRQALRPTGSRGCSVLVLSNDSTASFWDLMATYYHVPRLLLDRKQVGVVYHNSQVAPNEPTAVTDHESGRFMKDQEAVFHGTIILPQIAAYGPQPIAADLHGVLESATPGLRLLERATLFATPGVRVVDGTLISTGDPLAASDGTRNGSPSIADVTPTQRRGAEAIFGFTYLDPNGSADISSALVNISSGQDAYECYLSYNRTMNQIGLALDGAKAWDVMGTGSKRVLENSHCAVDGARSSTSASDNEFTLRLALRFKPAFAGQKKVFTTVADFAGSTTGWQPIGFWDVR